MGGAAGERCRRCDRLALSIAVGLAASVAAQAVAWCQEELEVVTEFTFESFTQESDFGRETTTGLFGRADLTMHNVSTPLADLHGTLRLGARVENERGERRQAGDIRADFSARTADYTLLLGTDLALSRQTAGFPGTGTQRPRRYWVSGALTDPQWPTLNFTWQRLATTTTGQFGESESRADRLALGAFYDIEPFTLSFDLAHDQVESRTPGGRTQGGSRDQRILRASARERLSSHLVGEAEFTRSETEEAARQGTDDSLRFAVEYTPAPGLALEARRSTLDSDFRLPGGRRAQLEEEEMVVSLRAEPLPGLFATASRQCIERRAPLAGDFDETLTMVTADAQLTPSTALIASLNRNEVSFGGTLPGHNLSESLSATLDHDMPDGSLLSLAAGRFQSTSRSTSASTSIETRFLGTEARLRPHPDLTLDLVARFGQSEEALPGSQGERNFHQFEGDLIWDLTPNAQLDVRATFGRAGGGTFAPEANRVLGTLRWRLSPRTEVLVAVGQDEVRSAQPALMAPTEDRTTVGARLSHEFSDRTNLDIRYGLSDQRLPVFLRSRDLIVQLTRQF